jgi:restriction system protein
LTPTEFETAVANLLSVHGFHAVRNLGGSGDLAADIVCLDSQEARVVVQCKRYAPGNRVGSKDMQLFIGMAVLHHEADYGMYVTTSTFTQPAIELAEIHGIELIDGSRLVEMAWTDDRSAAPGVPQRPDRATGVASPPAAREDRFGF